MIRYKCTYTRMSVCVLYVLYVYVCVFSFQYACARCIYMYVCVYRHVSECAYLRTQT